MTQHEKEEEKLLQVLKEMKGVEGRKPTKPTGDQYVESREIRYDMKYGGANASAGEVMIMVSVGSEFPPGIKETTELH